MGTVKLNNAGFKAIRQSAGVMAELNKQAQAMTNRANGLSQVKGAEYRTAPARTTDRGSIALVTTGHGDTAAVKAMVDNAKYDTLTKAIGQ
ncbi:hypothetical protein JS528_09555 [Bifidobacterium sp. MA2]|uniref:Phage protein n=1 Tax=Bifidobacterium santillanense TaxID=2809028 RepID=A0ABS5URG6_9BIFI|nr:hypothetical protein [Bifidobacterium santillanense]MBT1173580.1 hypothetical protein [Bifidobacterium santillanense]